MLKFAYFGLVAAFAVTLLTVSFDRGLLVAEEKKNLTAGFQLVAEIPIRDKPTPVVAPQPFPIPTPIPSPQPAPVPVTVPTPEPVPQPAITPLPELVPAPVPTPVPPSPAPIFEPAPVPVPAPSPALSPEPAPIPPPAIVNPVISEILFDAVGSDSGKEFIKIYNSNNADLNLENWSIKNGDSSLVKIGSKPEDVLAIKAQSYLVIGFSGNTNADLHRSATLPNGTATIFLLNADGEIIDQVSYDGANFEEGESWTR